MAANLTAPNDFAGGALNVTLSNSVDLPNGPMALWITASSGAVKVTTADGDAITFNVPSAGVICPFAVTRVWTTGTTVAAADIIALRYR